MSGPASEFLKRMYEMIVAIVGFFGALASGLVILRKIRSGLHRRRWFRRREDLAVPTWKQARQLERLVTNLAKAQEWFGSVQCEMARKLARELARVEWKVWAEALSYVALFSPSEERQCLALRNLSQVDDEGGMDRVKGVIQGVIEYPFTPDRVKPVAEAALKELERRERIRDRGKWPTTDRGTANGAGTSEIEQRPDRGEGMQAEDTKGPSTS